jgi:asparagine synthase (glutamine-hydrolysing)
VCGIAGLLSLDGGPIEAGDLDRASRAIAHRGPDDSGEWLDAERGVGLAHRRLSILDLSIAGHQPFASHDGAVQLVFNGEIYNFLELRGELEARGHHFRSRSDTEVIVEAYRAWGPSCVQRLRGMFAFGLWDAPRRRLVLARDRLGIKPLYVYRDERRVAFASELKAIEALPNLNLRIDDTALYDFLTYLYVPTPKTPYEHVRKLAPGHLLIVEDGRERLEEYWDVDFAPSRRTRVADVREKLEDAVRAHLVADVPVGSLLSGGVDSGAVTAIAQRLVSRPLCTFSIGFDEAAHSETQWARLVAERVGTTHTEEIVDVAEAERLLPRLGHLYDEPFADSSAIPTFVVSRLARRSVKVALSGDGGDEIFGGYSWYARHRRRARFAAVPSVLRAHLPALLEGSPLMRLRGVPMIVDGLRPDLERHIAIMGGYTRAQKRHVLSAERLRRFRDYDDAWHFRRYFRLDLDLMSRLQYLDIKTYLPDDILTKVDRASMAVALEVRPPLLDHVLVEHVAGLAPEERTPNGALKHALKGAVRDLLPREIIDRPKKGFSAPIDRWLPQLGGSATGIPNQAWSRLMLGQWQRDHGVGSLGLLA